jgi:predicted MFS family arabinose efflux permease
MAWPATFLTCFALGMMAIRGVLALTGMGRRPVNLLPFMIALAVAGYALLAFLPGGMARHLLSGLIYGAGYGMVHTLLLMNIFATTHPQRTGAAVGALFFAFDAATAFGALGLGWVMEHFGFRRGWAIGAVLMALAIPVARRIVRNSAAMTTEPDPSGILEG